MRNSLSSARALRTCGEPNQLVLFDASRPVASAVPAENYPGIAITQPVTDALFECAAVCVGVSGGKDSTAATVRTMDYVDEIGHSGPRLLIHSDLVSRGVEAVSAGL